MPSCRPNYPTVNYHPDRGPRPRPRPRPQTRRRSRPPSPFPPPDKLGPALSPWSFDAKTGAVLRDGKRLEDWERNLALLATRYPDRFDLDADLRGVRHKDRRVFNYKEKEVLRLVKKWPLDLAELEHSPRGEERVLSSGSIQRTTRTTDEMPRSTSDQTTKNDSIMHTASLPRIPTDQSPWTCEPSTGDIFAAGEPLTTNERRLVLLASHHLANFRDASVPKGGRPLTGWERELVDAARKFPVDFKNITDYYPAHGPVPESQRNKKKRKRRDELENERVLGGEEEKGHKTKALPDIPTDRSPWSANARAEEIFVSGERLSYFERRLVFIASRYPDKFHEDGTFKAKREPVLTGWERELVRAAKKFPIELGEVREEHKRYFEVGRGKVSDSLKEAIDGLRGT
ncbi:hypothetical protein FB567DRAFT_586330 [Paraphoma chrysanthemicola]|uniref:Uncharacterized protein n=1 Tax=Paraphoma chrysanthemicola TaxID=798071 RepID=A0A8K0W4M5_9PLEO|nr:hypothetical protein FB567DRAFT_586330 [Paraphoma chrysanthemicola]